MQKYFIYASIALGISSCRFFSQDQNIDQDIDSSENQLVSILDSEALSSEVPDTLELRLISLDLVDVQSLNPNIRVDLKYSSTDNFMATNVYGNLKRAYLQRIPAEMLDKAQRMLSEKDSNLYLLVYDAVRPVWVQWKMWNMLDTIPINKRVDFVSNPKNKSVHNFGAAVDLTICDVDGVPLDMGAGFDDIREIAYPRMEAHFLAKGMLTKDQINNRKLLREIMKNAGFRGLETEWWHFNAMSRDEAKKKYEVIP
jgi:D-alanyl-D-alanine dipeptidase